MQSYNAQFIEKKHDDEGDVYLTFKVSNWGSKQIIQELVKNVSYRIKMAEIKSKRTIEQNNLMWALIHEISTARNGDYATSEDDWDIYLEALELAQAKYEYVACLPEALPFLKEQFRTLKVINEFEHNNRTFKQVKVFSGSSKLDVKEMAKLLDTIIIMAQQEGIEIKEYGYE